MPEHMLMSKREIITDGGRRRRWTAAETLRIVEETLNDRAGSRTAPDSARAPHAGGGTLGRLPGAGLRAIQSSMTEREVPE
jgi:hypothetical protein